MAGPAPTTGAGDLAKAAKSLKATASRASSRIRAGALAPEMMRLKGQERVRMYTRYQLTTEANAYCPERGHTKPSRKDISEKKMALE
jgi:hypothetical protein